MSNTKMHPHHELTSFNPTGEPLDIRPEDEGRIHNPEMAHDMANAEYDARKDGHNPDFAAGLEMGRYILAHGGIELLLRPEEGHTEVEVAEAITPAEALEKQLFEAKAEQLRTTIREVFDVLEGQDDLVVETLRDNGSRMRTIFMSLVRDRRAEVLVLSETIVKDDERGENVVIYDASIQCEVRDQAHLDKYGTIQNIDAPFHQWGPRVSFLADGQPVMFDKAPAPFDMFDPKNIRRVSDPLDKFDEQPIPDNVEDIELILKQIHTGIPVPLESLERLYYNFPLTSGSTEAAKAADQEPDMWGGSRDRLVYLPMDIERGVKKWDGFLSRNIKSLSKLDKRYGKLLATASRAEDKRWKELDTLNSPDA
jgi:hypothetical protein